jgi:hypothetical protein
VGYLSPPLSKERKAQLDSIVHVPAVLSDWLPWFQWHARLAGTGALMMPSRPSPFGGAPRDDGVRVWEPLPAAPPFAVPEDGRVRLPPSGSSGVTPPDPGIRRRH